MTIPRDIDREREREREDACAVEPFGTISSELGRLAKVVSAALFRTLSIDRSQIGNFIYETRPWILELFCTNETRGYTLCRWVAGKHGDEKRAGAVKVRQASCPKWGETRVSLF